MKTKSRGLQLWKHKIDHTAAKLNKPVVNCVKSDSTSIYGELISFEKTYSYRGRMLQKKQFFPTS